MTSLFLLVAHSLDAITALSSISLYTVVIRENRVIKLGFIWIFM